MITTIDSSLMAVAEEIGRTIARDLALQLRQGELPISPEYLTAYQVAQMTGFTPKALENLRATRKGPQFYKVGASVRYRAEDVRAWIEAGGPVQ